MHNGCILSLYLPSLFFCYSHIVRLFCRRRRVANQCYIKNSNSQRPDTPPLITAAPVIPSKVPTSKSVTVQIMRSSNDTSLNSCSDGTGFGTHRQPGNHLMLIIAGRGRLTDVLWVCVRISEVKWAKIKCCFCLFHCCCSCVGLHQRR